MVLVKLGAGRCTMGYLDLILRLVCYISPQMTSNSANVDQSGASNSTQMRPLIQYLVEILNGSRPTRFPRWRKPVDAASGATHLGLLSAIVLHHCNKCKRWNHEMRLFSKCLSWYRHSIHDCELCSYMATTSGPIVGKSTSSPNNMCVYIQYYSMYFYTPSVRNLFYYPWNHRLDLPL